MFRLVPMTLRAMALSLVSASLLSAQSETMLYDHMHLAASDPQAAAQWYMDHIGGEEVDGRDERMLLGTTRFIWLRADDRRPSQGSVIDHVGFSVADLDAKLRELEAAGATITAPRRDVQGLFPLGFVEEALFKAYFSEGRDLGDPAVVQDVARSSGLDVGLMTKALDGGEYEGAITATTDTARQLGITGTPTFVFDKRFAVVGAQPAEALLQAIDAALKHTEEQ